MNQNSSNFKIMLVILLTASGVVFYFNQGAGIFVLFVSLCVVAGVYFSYIRPMNADNNLIRNGSPATATILEVSTTGATFNRNPQIKLLFLVKTSIGEEYKLEKKIVVSLLSIHSYQPGAQLNVKVDLMDKNKLAIESFC